MNLNKEKKHSFNRQSYTLIFLVFQILLLSCEKDEIAGSLNLGTNCDTTSVTYQKDIEPIISKKCLGCHNDNKQLAGVNLKSYELVKYYGLKGELINSIFANMGAYVSDCDRAKILAFVNQGFRFN